MRPVFAAHLLLPEVGLEGGEEVQAVSRAGAIGGQQQRGDGAVAMGFQRLQL